MTPIPIGTNVYQVTLKISAGTSFFYSVGLGGSRKIIRKFQRLIKFILKLIFYYFSIISHFYRFLVHFDKFLVGLEFFWVGPPRSPISSAIARNHIIRIHRGRASKFYYASQNDISYKNFHQDFR